MENLYQGLPGPTFTNENGDRAILYHYFEPSSGQQKQKLLTKNTFMAINQTGGYLPVLGKLENRDGVAGLRFVQFWVMYNKVVRRREVFFSGYEDFDFVKWDISDTDIPSGTQDFVTLIRERGFTPFFDGDQELTNQIINDFSKPEPAANPAMQEKIAELNRDFHLADSMNLKELKEIIKFSEESYYNSISDPLDILDDKVYDYIKDLYEMESLEAGQESTISSDGMGHVPEPKGRLLKLPVWLGGMTKINHGSGEMLLWTNKYKGPFVISAKMDGASALQFWEDGELKLYSRGRGGKAQNISELLQYLNLPELPKNYMVRGELIMKKSVFEQKYKRVDKNSKEGYRNIRNAVAGLVNKTGSRAAGSKNSDLPLDSPFLGDLDFIVYEIISDPPMKASDQYAYMDKTYGSRVAPHTILETVNDDIMSQAYDYYRTNMDYEIDGMIMCDDHVHERPYGENFPYIRAYKKPLQNLMATTMVKSVEWNVSKDRLIKPVLIIEPVEIDGTSTERATAYNARYIMEKSLGPGAIIQITRSGGVIPKVLQVFKPAPEGGSLPVDKYKFVWNANKVEIVLDDDDLNSPANREVVIKKISYFLKTIDAKGIGEETIDKLYEIGVRTIPNLLQLRQEHVAFLGPKASQNLINTLQSTIVDIPLPILGKASGAFGKGFGKSLLTNVFETYPAILESREVQTNDIPKIIQLISVLPDFAEVRSEQIAAGFYKFLQFLKEMHNVGYKINSLRYEPPKTAVTIENHELKGINIAFTGFTKSKDEGISSFVERVGGTIQDRLKSDTKLLIVKDINSSSSKAKTAREKGIPLISKEQFIAKYLS